jgi:hypothetical protein
MDNRIVLLKVTVLQSKILGTVEGTNTEVALMQKELLRKKMDDERWRLGLPGVKQMSKSWVLPLSTSNAENVVQKQDRVVQLETRHLVLKLAQFVG